MKISQHVCSIEQAKRLKELGILQDSVWYYIYYTNSDRFYINLRKTANSLYSYSLKKYGDDCVAELCSAFTLSELAALLDIETGAFDPVKLADELIAKIGSGVHSVEDINLRFYSNDMTDCEIMPIERAG